jgi:exosortase
MSATIFNSLRRSHLAALAFLLSTTALYARVIVKLLSDWWADPDYSHAFLVVPLATFLVWQRRADLIRAERSGSAFGFVIVCGALLLLLVGSLGAELFLTRISLLTFLAGSVIFLFGWRHLRMLVFPLALVLLTIPIPSIVISRLTLSLQLAASNIAEVTLNALRIPVLREGNVLVLPNAALQVAEACSGIRSLTALVTLALVVARFSDARWGPRTIIVASAIPIAVLVNGLRVAAAAIGAHFYGTAAVEGFVHELLGWLMFLVAFALMAGCARAVRGRRPRARLAAP